MNAILIAGAGINRLESFAKIPAEEYRPLVDDLLFEKIQGDIRRYSEFVASGIVRIPLPEKFFPTAPGQGVLALQFSYNSKTKFASELDKIFPEHHQIAPRVTLERRVMTELNTGCHAPLGVSAERTAYPGIYSLALCFSRENSIEAINPTFSDPVYMRRYAETSVSDLVSEIRRPFATAFWWGGGLKKIPSANFKIHAIDAIKQKLFDEKSASTGAKNFAAVFVSSPAVFFWLKKNPAFADLPLWTAGRETAAELLAVFPHAQVKAAEDGRRGFAPAYEAIRKANTGALLWLGSLSGEERARRTVESATRRIGSGDLQVEFLAVYDNVPLPVADLQKQYPLLADPLLVPKSIHLITSASAAAAFLNLAKGEWHENLKASCFGESAAEYLISNGFVPYHLSEAESFAEYIREISGDAGLMSRFLAP